MIVALNGKLVLDQIGDWVDLAAAIGRMVGPIPLVWLVARRPLRRDGAVRRLLLALGDAQALVSASPAWLPQPSVKLDWVEALRPRPLATIGVALEHDQADAEILNRALGLAQTQNGQTELVLLHVVDTPITRSSTAPKPPTARRGRRAIPGRTGRARCKERGLLGRARSCCTVPTRPASSSS